MNQTRHDADTVAFPTRNAWPDCGLTKLDIETSTLGEINKVLKLSGLDTAEQRRVLQYLLERRQPVVGGAA